MTRFSFRVAFRLSCAPSIRWLALCCSVSACSLLVDGDREQCSVTADCVARGGAFSQSTCVDGFCVLPEADDDTTDDVPNGNGAMDAGPSTEPDSDGGPEARCTGDEDCAETAMCIDGSCVDPFACPVEASTGPIRITTTVTEVFGSPLPNLPTRLCRNIDPECQTPLAEPMTDAYGMLTLDLPDEFIGYLEFTPPGFFPQLQFLPPSPPADSVLPNISLSQTEVILGLGQAVGAPPDPERGHLHLTILNCLGPAGGVQLSSTRADEQTIAYYVLDGVPSADLTETTAQGGGGFLNFPTGNTAVTVTHSETQQELGKLSFVIRAGFVTVATLRPVAE